jgi:hypothetical protein
MLARVGRKKAKLDTARVGRKKAVVLQEHLHAFAFICASIIPWMTQRKKERKKELINKDHAFGEKKHIH